MSPPSGYSSGGEDVPYANAEALLAINKEVERLRDHTGEWAGGWVGGWVKLYQNPDTALHITNA